MAANDSAEARNIELLKRLRGKILNHIINIEGIRRFIVSPTFPGPPKAHVKYKYTNPYSLPFGKVKVINRSVPQANGSRKEMYASYVEITPANHSSSAIVITTDRALIQFIRTLELVVYSLYLPSIFTGSDNSPLNSRDIPSIIEIMKLILYTLQYSVLLYKVDDRGRGYYERLFNRDKSGTISISDDGNSKLISILREIPSIGMTEDERYLVADLRSTLPNANNSDEPVSAAAAAAAATVPRGGAGGEPVEVAVSSSHTPAAAASSHNTPRIRDNVLTKDYPYMAAYNFLIDGTRFAKSPEIIHGNIAQLIGILYTITAPEPVKKKLLEYLKDQVFIDTEEALDEYNKLRRKMSDKDLKQYMINIYERLAADVENGKITLEGGKRRRTHRNRRRTHSKKRRDNRSTHKRRGN